MISTPLATVVICTRNRSSSLARTLDSIVVAASHVDEIWELVIVDNGSTDDTPGVIESYAGRLPVRRALQPTPGLSNARNAGVAAAKGRYFLWTDDDVIVDRDWLRAWFRAFKERPNDAVFGGRAEPRYEEPHQAWFRANEKLLASLLAIRDRPEWETIGLDRLPFGLNYAIRGVEQRRHLYDPDLGVAPGRRRGGEETAVLRAILAEGGTGSWVWDATVFHIIPAERQHENYIRSYYEAHGFDYPIKGIQQGALNRLRAVLGCSRALLKSGLYYLHLRQRDRAQAVRWLVLNARASGSISRHLGQKGPFPDIKTRFSGKR
jgi:glycosyltransferase involved in cell wall biosynthesis